MRGAIDGLDSKSFDFMGTLADTMLDYMAATPKWIKKFKINVTESNH